VESARILQRRTAEAADELRSRWTETSTELLDRWTETADDWRSRVEGTAEDWRERSTEGIGRALQNAAERRDASLDELDDDEDEQNAEAGSDATGTPEQASR
jgi:hypothetical protein